jgi:hypothetical protein
MKLRETLAYFIIFLFVYLLVRLSSLDFDLDSIISGISSLKDRIDEENHKKALDFYEKLFASEHMTYLTSEKDAFILETIFKSIDRGTNRFYVEFISTSEQKSSVHYLKTKYNWKGFHINETTTTHTILKLLKKNNVPKEFDLFSDLFAHKANYLIIEKMLTKYKPKVVVHQVKQESGTLCGTAVRSSTFIENQLDERSVCAFYCLAKRFGYSMVYCGSTGRHCFLIRNDLLKKHVQVDPEVLQLSLNPIFLHQKIGLKFADINWNKDDC